MATPEKRDAALAAMNAEAADDASAARTWPISVHLTPFAPGCATMAIDNRKRWRTFYGKTPAQVVRTTLTRLSLAPAAVSVATENGDTQVMAAPGQVLGGYLREAPPATVPFAVFWDGLSPAQLTAELDALARAGWRPGSLAEA